jgi:hypothetical protein
MPQDHYVAQRYLRAFADPDTPERIHAYRKSDCGYFSPSPAAVCRRLRDRPRPCLQEFAGSPATTCVRASACNRGDSGIGKFLKYAVRNLKADLRVGLKVGDGYLANQLSDQWCEPASVAR